MSSHTGIWELTGSTNTLQSEEGPAARSAALRASQPSKGQATVRMLRTEREPMLPSRSSQIAGVSSGETSLQDSPGVPMNTTGWGSPSCGVAVSSEAAAAFKAGAEPEVAAAPAEGMSATNRIKATANRIKPARERGRAVGWFIGH